MATVLLNAGYFKVAPYPKMMGIAYCTIVPKFRAVS